MDSLSEQRPQDLTRSKSSFSFRSHKSDRSSGSKTKIDLTETENEKRRSRFSQRTKANPNQAINEEQPSTIAQIEQPTLLPLRSIQHKDWNTGSLITDPDASNPSRSRLERPLDTIRSFEAAVDGGYMRRAPPTRTESADAATAYSSRRSSVVGGYSQGYEGQYVANPRYTPANGYDAARRPMYGRPNYDYGRGQPMPQQRRGMGQRLASAPVYNRPPPPDQGTYNIHTYHDSHDTVYTGESSQSEPWANSTDPSSENSSVDRIQAIKQMEPSGDAYGAQHGQSPNLHGVIAEEGRQDLGTSNGQPLSSATPNPKAAPQMNRPPGVRYPPTSQQNQQNSPSRPFTRPDGAQWRPGPPQANLHGQQPPSQNQRQPLNANEPKRAKLEKKPEKKPAAEKPKSWLRRRFSKG